MIIRLSALLLLALVLSAAPSFAKPNVLFIAVDDLNTDVGCYGHPLVKTPNIDALAQRGVRFDRAYCQYPLCNPSRTSMLTGRLPTATGVLNNTTDFRQLHPDWTTLPEHFKKSGYVTLRTGKIYHGGIDDAQSWTEAADPPRKPGAPPRPRPDPAVRRKNSDRIVTLPGNGESHGDFKTAEKAIEYLQTYKDKPF